MLLLPPSDLAENLSWTMVYGKEQLKASYLGEITKAPDQKLKKRMGTVTPLESLFFHLIMTDKRKAVNF